MKLSKISWLLLIGGIFLVIVISLGLTRSQQIQAQGRLDEELSVAETRLGKLQLQQQQQQQQKELQEQLDEARVQLLAAKNKLRQPVASIDVTDGFYAVARSCGVTVESISSSPLRSGELGEIGCSMIVLNASVTGATSNLIDFVIRLNSDFTTGVVRSAQVTIPETSVDEEPSVSVQMFVYAYEGS